MKFTKMQGIGNDYVYINCFEEAVGDPVGLAVAISDRHFGVGSDGLVLICPSTVADFKMRMFNADGSEAEMCGNAARCVGKYVYEKKMTDKTRFTLDTLGGIKEIALDTKDGIVTSVRVNMGQPCLDPAHIPVDLPGDKVVAYKIPIGGEVYEMTCLSMGNPHAVVFVADTDKVDIEKIGPLFENHHLFPKRTNVEFVEVMGEQELKMRVWERGAGETMACGTGACAALTAAVLNGKTQRNTTIHLLGGDLQVQWNEDDGCVYKTGPAAFSFEGEYELEGIHHGGN